MRLVIEIDNAALREAVEAQVGKELAAMTEEVILAKADEIIARKFERFDFNGAVESVIGRAIKSKIDTAIADALGAGRSEFEQRKAICKIFQETSLAMIKLALK